MATNNSINVVTAASGKVLQGQGIGSTPAFSTATYPATATGTGTVLRADGTNWSATTATYPNTTTANRILYSSATNTISEITSANSGVLTTNSSGVPSIDTTNFQVLTTGVQMKGNNTNTAPPAGYIGEQIRATVSLASAITLTNVTAANVTSISLTAGIWDVSGIVMFPGAAITGTQFSASINTTSATLGTAGDNFVQTPTPPTSSSDQTLTIPSYRLTLGSTTTVYLIAMGAFSVGTLKAYGRISGTRVG